MLGWLQTACGLSLSSPWWNATQADSVMCAGLIFVRQGHGSVADWWITGYGLHFWDVFREVGVRSGNGRSIPIFFLVNELLILFLLLNPVSPGKTKIRSKPWQKKATQGTTCWHNGCVAQNWKTHFLNNIFDVEMKCKSGLSLTRLEWSTDYCHVCIHQRDIWKRCLQLSLVFFFFYRISLEIICELTANICLAISQVLQLCCLQTSNGMTWRGDERKDSQLVTVFVWWQRTKGAEILTCLWLLLWTAWMEQHYHSFGVLFVSTWGNLSSIIKDFGLYQIQMDTLLVLDAPLCSITWKQFDCIQGIMFLIIARRFFFLLKKWLKSVR